jgi:hypothetical protein
MPRWPNSAPKGPFGSSDVPISLLRLKDWAFLVAAMLRIIEGLLLTAAAGSDHRLSSTT